MIDPRARSFSGRFPKGSEHFWHEGTLYPLTVFRARYGGVYEDGEWLAFNENTDKLKDAEGDDLTCVIFFEAYSRPIGRGQTANMAIQDLEQQILELGENDGV